MESNRIQGRLHSRLGYARWSFVGFVWGVMVDVVVVGPGLTVEPNGSHNVIKGLTRGRKVGPEEIFDK